MVAVPSVMAEMRPLLLTVTTFVLLLLHVTFLLVALLGITVAVSCSVWSTGRVVEVLFNETPVTGCGITVTSQKAVLFPSVVVMEMMAVPTAIAVMRPLLLIVAMVVLLLRHVTVGLSASLGDTVGVSCSVAPTFSVVDVLFNVTPVTRIAPAWVTVTDMEAGSEFGAVMDILAERCVGSVLGVTVSWQLLPCLTRVSHDASLLASQLLAPVVMESVSVLGSLAPKEMEVRSTDSAYVNRISLSLLQATKRITGNNRDSSFFMVVDILVVNAYFIVINLNMFSPDVVILYLWFGLVFLFGNSISIHPFFRRGYKYFFRCFE